MAFNPEKYIKMDIRILERMQEQLETAKYSRVQVGIFANKNKTYPSGASVVEAAYKNEYGFVVYMWGRRFLVPARSFLRMPIATGINHIKSVVAGGLAKAVREGKLKQWLKRLGIAAEARVDDAFATSGFGEWEPNSGFTIKMKGSDKPLIDTGSLRRAIASRVVDKRVQ